MAADTDTNTDPNVDRGDNLDPKLLDPKSALADAGKGDAGDKADKVDKSDDSNKDPGDETPEEKAEREAAEAAEEAKKRIRIPKHRFDEAVAQARKREQTLLAEIEKLKGDKQDKSVQTDLTKMSNKVEELQDKYEDLILDGKKDEARKIRREIDQLREQLIETKTNLKSDAARKSAVEELRYDSALAAAEAKHPELNPDHPDFNEDTVGEVILLLESFVARGFSRHNALQKAVKYVLGNAKTPDPDDAKGKDAKDAAAAKLAADQRAAEARKKAADADKRQPAGTKGVGLDTDKAGGKLDHGIDVMRLTQEKFNKLDEETLSKLRGDVV